MVRIRRPWVILGLILGAFAPRATLAQEVRFLAPVYGQVGLGNLENQTKTGFLGDEIRITTSFSYVLPNSLVVVRRDLDSGWTGNVWMWSPGLSNSAGREIRSSSPCFGVDFTAPSVCEPRPASEINWEYVGSQVFDSLDVRTLPDVSSLPAPQIEIVDGLFLFAEIASRGEYRTVSWINHEVRQEPEAGRALSLHTLVDLLAGFPCSDASAGPWKSRVVFILRKGQEICIDFSSASEREGE